MALRPKVDELLEKVDSRFTLVVLAAKRARQINSYLKGLKEQTLVQVRPPEVDSISRDPLEVALEEIAEGKITYERTVEDIK